MTESLDPHYDHKTVEEKIYKLWEKSGYLNPDNLPSRTHADRTRNNAERDRRRSALSQRQSAFCIIMPPPNANGALHIGHAVGITLEDILVRFWRMRGRRALWLPGADHAGFETQVVFDKKLEKEGRSRFTMPREEVWREIWDFTQENKKIMESQLRKLGASSDWSREKFTLDPKIIDEVQKTFVKMYEDGLIYRDLKVVNWCPKHKTALSDLEVKYIEKKDPLYFIKYGPLTLATVRPETKFGDTALAVNPHDKRYKKYIGKEIQAEGLLGPLKFKVIADGAVDPKFGTGVVKVTPAHDAVDFEVWQRHKDEIPGPKIIIDENGRLTSETGEFKGLKVTEAREKIAEAMKEKGILEKIEPNYVHQVATCYKCGTTLEPLPKPQWFVKMKPLAEKAIKAVEQGKIKFYPDRAKKVYFHWLKNIRDWNISRQIVWGIRIPAWFCGSQEKAGQPKMGFAGDVVPQVLDGKTKTYRLRNHGFKVGDKVLFENSQTKTLFGYGVIKQIEEMRVEKIDYRDKTHYKTYNNLGELMAAFKLRNPDKEVTQKTPAYLYAYEFHKFSEKDTKEGCGNIITSGKAPEKCLSCGGKNLTQDPDVFDTWFSSGQWPFLTLGYPNGNDYKTFYPTDVMETGYDILFFWVARMIMMGLYRTGKIPFKTVYLHGLVRDKDRKKMSKSRGNVIDPLGVAEIYGTDAVRMALVVGNTAGNDIVISEDKIRAYRNFATKIWNAARFILMNKPLRQVQGKLALTATDKKHLKDLVKMKAQVTKHLEKFEFHLAAEKLYHYFWHAFADKIIEKSKDRLQNGSEGEKRAAYHTLETILLESLKMLHPFMPFITEEIFQKLQPKKLIIVEKW